MVGKHHAAGTDADRLREARYIGHDHSCRRARDAGHVVMLGKPKAMITPCLHVAPQITAVVQGLGRRRPFIDGREVENGKPVHAKCPARSAASSTSHPTWFGVFAVANKFVISRLNAGMSSGLRLVSNPLSTTASSSTQLAPAFLRSVRSEGHEVKRRPRAAPASMTVQGP